MPRSTLSVNGPARTRWLRRTLMTAFVAALLAAAGLVTASPAAAKRISDPDLVASVGCSTGDDGAGVLQLSWLFEGYDYTWAVTGEGYSVGGTFAGTGYVDDAEIAIEGLAPGVYITSVAVENFDPVLGEFTVEACPPDLGVAVTPLQCSTGDNGAALLTLTGLVPGEGYTYSVTGPTFEVGGMLDEVGETEEIELGGMPPGNYVAYSEQVVQQPEAAAAVVPPTPNFDWVVFAIEPCQPDIVVEVTECTAAGGTGAVDVTLSNLVAGVEYDVWVTDGGDADGIPVGDVLTVTGEPDGTAALEASGLPAGHDYTVWVEGVWVAEPWEEPPFVGGGGGFTPLESVVLAASADFTLAPCPAAPAATPVKPAALPPTGPDGVAGLLAGSMLLLGLGGALLLVRRRVTRS
jgi:hypothetical protein